MLEFKCSIKIKVYYKQATYSYKNTIHP